MNKSSKNEKMQKSYQNSKEKKKRNVMKKNKELKEKYGTESLQKVEKVDFGLK